MPILTNNVDNSWGKNFPFFKLGRPGQNPLRKSFIMKENNHRLATRTLACHRKTWQFVFQSRFNNIRLLRLAGKQTRLSGQ